MHPSIAMAVNTRVPCLPDVRVVCYDEKVKARDRAFANIEEAGRFVERNGWQRINVYRINRVNGQWSTAWYDTNYDLPPA